MAFGLRPSRNLENLLLKNIVSDVIQRRPKLNVKRALEILLRHPLSSRIWLIHDLDPRIAKEVLRMRIKKEKSDIERLGQLLRTRYNAQAPSQLQRRHLLCRRIEFASDFTQIVSHQIDLEISDIRLHVRTIIERHIARQFKKLFLNQTGRLDRTRHLPDIIGPRRLALFQNSLGTGIRTLTSTRSPDNQQSLSLVLDRFDNGQIKRLNQMANAQQLLLNAVDRSRRQTLHRKDRLAVLLLHAQNHISAAPVVKVIGKCTKRMQNLFRVPPLLVLNASPFHLAVVNQVVYVDRERHKSFFTCHYITIRPRHLQQAPARTHPARFPVAAPISSGSSLVPPH